MWFAGVLSLTVRHASGDTTMPCFHAMADALRVSRNFESRQLAACGDDLCKCKHFYHPSGVSVFLCSPQLLVFFCSSRVSVLSLTVGSSRILFVAGILFVCGCHLTVGRAV